MRKGFNDHNNFLNLDSLQHQFNDLIKAGKNPFYIAIDIDEDSQTGYNTKAGSCKGMSLQNFYNYVRDNSCKNIKYAIKY